MSPITPAVRVRSQDSDRLFGLFLVVVYAAWLITTPFNSPRLGFLETIRFERFLAAGLLLYVIANKPSGDRYWTPIGYFIGFVLVCYVGYFLSPIARTGWAQTWFDDYWKRVYLLLMMCLIVRDDRDVARVILGITAVCIIYQLLSWKDFMLGGSYVYQQGLKRMVGTWSGGGIGAANGWGFFAVFTIPFVIASAQLYGGRWTIRLIVAGVGLCVASMLASGTRGAFVTAAVLGLLYFLRNVRRRLIVLTVAIPVILVTPSLLPDEQAARFYSVIASLTGQEVDLGVDEKAAATAEHSAESRWLGLVDGFNLMLDQPVYGWGPGQSAVARVRYGNTEGRVLQLHSFHGQILGETGLLGTTLFAIALICILLPLLAASRNRDVDEASDARRTIANGLLYAYVSLLVYGLASHNLYSHNWIIVMGLAVPFVSSMSRSKRRMKPALGSPLQQPGTDARGRNETALDARPEGGAIRAPLPARRTPEKVAPARRTPSRVSHR